VRDVDIVQIWEAAVHIPYKGEVLGDVFQQLTMVLWEPGDGPPSPISGMTGGSGDMISIGGRRLAFVVRLRTPRRRVEPAAGIIRPDESNVVPRTTRKDPSG
jgi:hypothetical protein